MTLLVTALTRDDAYFFSDRQITNLSTGAPNSELAKVLYVESKDARFIVGFCGLAFAGTGVTAFRADDFISDSIYSAAECSASTPLLVGEIRKNASSKFSEHPDIRQLAQAHKRLQIVLVGFRANGDPFKSIVSNSLIAASGGFQSTASENFFGADIPFVGPEIQFHGSIDAIQEHDRTRLSEMLRPDLPREAIIGRGIDIIREIADRPLSRGTIGKDIQLCRISRIGQGPAVSSYFPNGATEQFHVVGQIKITDPSRRMAIRNIRIQAEGVKVLDQTQRKRQPCWCGSGKRYKNCHGKGWRRWTLGRKAKQ